MLLIVFWLLAWKPYLHKPFQYNNTSGDKSKGPFGYVGLHVFEHNYWPKQIKKDILQASYSPGVIEF